MDIVYQCSESGHKLYAVRQHGRDLFVGRREECIRFLSIYESKLTEERESDLRPPRRQASVSVRTYRAACRVGV